MNLAMTGTHEMFGHIEGHGSEDEQMEPLTRYIPIHNFRGGCLTAN